MMSHGGPRRDPDSVAGLNSVLGTSLSIITQFFFHSSLLKTLGAFKLASRYHGEWFDKMRRSDTVLDRILDLGDKPASRAPSELHVGHDVREILRSDLALEEKLMSDLREASTRSELSRDLKMYDLLTGILKAEQAFTDWLREQLDQVEREGAGKDGSGRRVRDGLTLSREKVVASLNEVLKIELSAITQVYYHSRMLETWGITKLHEFHAAETLEKTYRSVAMLKRLLALDGMPAAEDHGKLSIGRDVPEMLSCDYQVQETLIPSMQNALDCCDSHVDHETREMLRTMLDCERKHSDWIRAQFEQIKQQGLEPYLQSQR